VVADGVAEDLFDIVETGERVKEAGIAPIGFRRFDGGFPVFRLQAGSERSR